MDFFLFVKNYDIYWESLISYDLIWYNKINVLLIKIDNIIEGLFDIQMHIFKPFLLVNLAYKKSFDVI